MRADVAGGLLKELGSTYVVMVCECREGSAGRGGVRRKDGAEGAARWERWPLVGRWGERVG